MIKNTTNKKLSQGQATIEYIIVFPVMIMLVFGILQFTLIYNAKTTLNYAVFEAARAGSLNNARRDAVAEAFASGMAALYTHKANVEAVEVARVKVWDEIEAGDQVCIERVNPIDDDFSGYAIDHPDILGQQAIPVDNLVYREPAITGGAHVSIHDATLLKIKVTYCYPLYVPFLNQLIPEWFTGNAEKGYVSNDPGFGSFKSTCIDNRQLPIVADAIMRMQSPVINDPSYSTAAQCS